MTEAREIRHSYGCVKESDMVLLRRVPKVKRVIESILGLEVRKFCIAEVKVLSRYEEEEADLFDWRRVGLFRKQMRRRKVYIDAVTGTMYDYHTKVCLSSSNIKIVE